MNIAFKLLYVTTWLYLPILQKSFNCQFTTHEECVLLHSIQKPYHSYSWNFSHLGNGFTSKLFTRSVYWCAVSMTIDLV